MSTKTTMRLLKTRATAPARRMPRATSRSTIGLSARVRKTETMSTVIVVVRRPASCQRPTASSTPVAPKKPM